MPFDTTYYTYSHARQSTTVTISRSAGDVQVYTIEKDDAYPSDPERDAFILDSLQTLHSNWGIKKSAEPDYYQPAPGLVFTFLGILMIVGLLAIREALKEAEEAEAERSNPAFDTGAYERPARHRYDGAEMRISGQYCHGALLKHFPYYAQLGHDDQVIFNNRLLRFIEQKTFTIHSHSPFIEMPLLVSATAIQLTFGLKKFLLPHFDHIHIYPQEFMRVEPVICFLEGNVSGHRINLSWKHFLEGIQTTNDGKNVGLHEMAHALYYQAFVAEQHSDRHFRKHFDAFNGHGNKVYHTEMNAADGLYSEYAMSNFQEFWAESVELFFEKPLALRDLYPSLYDTMSLVLNQCPLRSGRMA